jgi:hypothetical protein
VAAFRLGEYQRAEAAFSEVARTPAMSALAHYNLGLVALKRGDQSAARRWFERVARESSDERLTTLAAERLGSLPPVPERDWVGYASLGAGYDDNVALVSSSDVLGVSGTDAPFAELQLAASGPLSQPWRLDAGLIYLDYHDLDDFDQLSVHGGGGYEMDLGDWRGEVAAQLEYTLLDSEGFENRRSLALQATRALSSTWRLRAHYRFSDIDGMEDFDGLSGERHEVGVRGDWLGEPWQLALEYRLESSDHDDETLSADRHQLAFDAQRKLVWDWTVELDAALRSSSYDVSGDEDLLELSVAVARPLSDRLRFIVRYTYTDNDANRDEFAYERNRIAALLEAML